MAELDSQHLSEAYGDEVPLSSSFRCLLSEGAENNLDGPAIVSLYQPKDRLSALTIQRAQNVEHTVWTYNELKQAAGQLAMILHGHGVRKGSVIACFLWNSIEWVVFCWAAAALNATFAPLDLRVFSRPNELKHILQTLRVDVLVVQDSDVARNLEKAASQDLQGAKLKVICEGVTDIESWQMLRTLGDETPLIVDWNSLPDTASGDDLALILFTSGTTNLPKACGHTARSLGSQSEFYRKTRRINRTHKMIFHSPNFHVAAFWNSLCAWRAGATLVIASPRFDPDATLKGIRSQGCTHLAASPSMLSALFNHSSFLSQKPTTLQLVAIGAEMVAPHLIETCKNTLGKEVVIWSGWGMTEGNGLISWDQDERILPRDGILPIGRVMPGAKIRICEIGSRKPLKRGEEGELHCAGTSVIRAYLNQSASDSFYVDGETNWLVTGDRALMDEEGRVYILGRYKDIIIRGGENLSPAVIESCLNGHSGIMSQVIGIADPIMGEVPIAVVKQTPSDVETSRLKATLRETIIRNLGTQYALAGVFTLKDLGLDSFPLTPSGKTRKADLKTLVSQHLQNLEQQRTDKEQSSVMVQLKEIWANILGHSVDTITLSADSLTIMRFCYEVEKICGKRISPTEVYENQTIQDQARLLRSKEDAHKSLNIQVRQSDGPPSPRDMIPTFGDVASAEKAEELVKPALEEFDLTWQDDVEDLYRNNDVMRELYSSPQRAASFNIRWAYEIKDVTVTTLRQALEESLIRHSTLRSIFVQLEDKMPIHVIIRPTKRWFNRCITVGPDVNTINDVRALIRDMSLGFAGPSAPLFRAIITPIKDTGTLGFIMSVHHSTFDAFSMSAFLQDFDAILNNETNKLNDRIPFKLYADTYHMHKHGPTALDSVRYSVNRLKGIKNFTKALWPTQKGPEWFVGDDSGWTYRNGQPGKPEDRRAFDREDNRPEGVAIYRKDNWFHLRTLGERHSLQAPTVIKAAVTIFNTEVTGQAQAIFCDMDNARKWPFLESWITDQLPNPLAIAGPTMEQRINILTVDPEETTVAFLTRIQDDQKEQSTYTTPPSSAIVKHLDEEEGLMIHDIGKRQVMNWDPALRMRMSDAYRSLHLLGRQGWLDLGVFWSFGLLDEETLVSFIVYDDAHLRHEEASAALLRVVEIAQWMTAPENWQKRVGECGNRMTG